VRADWWYPCYQEDEEEEEEGGNDVCNLKGLVNIPFKVSRKLL
jgi:hypothetical protein